MQTVRPHQVGDRTLVGYFVSDRTGLAFLTYRDGQWGFTYPMIAKGLSQGISLKFAHGNRTGAIKNALASGRKVFTFGNWKDIAKFLLGNPRGEPDDAHSCEVVTDEYSLGTMNAGSLSAPSAESFEEILFVADAIRASPTSSPRTTAVESRL